MTTTSEGFIEWSKRPENIRSVTLRRLAFLAVGTTVGMTVDHFGFFYSVGFSYLLSIPLNLLLSILRYQLDKR